MIQTQRHERILKYLAQDDYLTVAEAIKLFSASPATVRRDFNKLAQESLAQRFRGGLKAIPKTSSGMVPFALRQVQHSVEKEALARRAATLLHGGDVIFVDGGTTTCHLGMCLPDFALRVITNSVRLASVLEEKRADLKCLEIYLTGGFLYPNSGLLLGPGAQTALSQYHARLAFLSVGGINLKGIFNTNEMVVETERVMIDNADKVVILADHSKIGKHAMCHVCGLDKIDILITDEYPENQSTLDNFKETGLEVVTVKCGL